VDTQFDDVAIADPGDRAPVHDFDFYLDPRFSETGCHHAVLVELNDAPPIFWSPSCGGYWVIRSHALAFEAAQATDLFSSRAMNIPRDDAELGRRGAIPITLDPPDHARYREPLAKLFGPQRMIKMEAKIRAMAIELIEAVRPQGGCDFVKDVAEPLPVLTFMDLMGMDHRRLREFRELAVVGSVDPDPEKRKAGSARVSQIMSEFVDERLANPHDGADDLTAQLMAIRIDDRPITVDELKAYFQLLFFAGLDTVVNAMAFSVNYLARHADLQAQCRGNIGKVKLVAEELLRLGAPAVPGRVVTRDQLWHGATLRKGDRALLGLAQANIDPSVFPDPLACNPGRTAINHLTFNAGPHRCIGQHLARIELRVMYEEWLARIPAFRPDPDRAPRMHGGMVMGVDTLPLVWDA
jgi:cytochrome P450